MFSLADYIQKKYTRRDELQQNLVGENAYQQGEVQQDEQDELRDPLHEEYEAARVRIQQQMYREVHQNNAQLNDAAGENAENPQVNGRRFNFTGGIIVLMLYSISISLTVYGAIHLNDCPAEKMIPISWVVVGSLLLLSRILSIQQEFRSIFYGETTVSANLCLLCLNFIVQIALMCFFFAICYWIFHIKPDTKPEHHDLPNYCELEFYRNTYYGSIVGLVLFGLMFLGVCCGACIISGRIIADMDI